MSELVSPEHLSHEQGLFDVVRTAVDSDYPARPAQSGGRGIETSIAANIEDALAREITRKARLFEQWHRPVRQMRSGCRQCVARKVRDGDVMVVAERPRGVDSCLQIPELVVGPLLIDLNPWSPSATSPRTSAAPVVSGRHDIGSSIELRLHTWRAKRFWRLSR
jgi:hypothetical protein